MSRTNKDWPAFTARQVQRSKPPMKVSRNWRQQFRARANRELREAKDYDALVMPVKIWERSSLFDWY